jgi:Icc-related predicted phosphoesterase
MIHAGHELNDHALIRYREESGHISRFMPWHAAAEHRLDRAFLNSELDRWHDGTTVVVTHHAPHPGSVQRRHQGSPLSPAFASDLSELIIPYQPEVWIHGHDHGCHDYQVGETRIFSNQAGYPNGRARENSGFNPLAVIQVGEGST